VAETGILLAIQRYRTKQARGATRAERKLETHERLLTLVRKLLGVKDMLVHRFQRSQAMRA
jgi:hypothetical protein